MKRVLKNKHGFTLIEFVVVVALAAALIGLTAILLGKGKAAATFSTTQERIRAISTGLTEYTMYKHSLPLAKDITTTWPAALNDYVEADFRTGSIAHGYQCASSDLVLQTPTFESNDSAKAILTRLLDQRICESDSAVSDTNAINCVVTGFKGTARCR